MFSPEVPLKKPDQKPSPCRLQKPEWNEKSMEAPTAVTDKFPPGYLWWQLTKNIKKIYFRKLRQSLFWFLNVSSQEMILTGFQLQIAALSLFIQRGLFVFKYSAQWLVKARRKKLRIFIIMNPIINKLWEFIWMYLFKKSSSPLLNAESFLSSCFIGSPRSVEFQTKQIYFR